MTAPRPLSLILALGLAAGLAACATPADTDASAASTPAPAAPVASAPATEPAPTAEEPAMTCVAEKGQWAKGNVADEALVAKVKADTGSDRVRVIQPGMAVTMDYREDRLNLDVDADNRVTAVRCG
ncbi:I78 family peptidase inhibitor [Arenimonas sp. MALMAid1274]|uniref:I78 family peptidase inhibitor n=1 Tax=Arenimonas sp. MALMAid1274 TaxID=3411630 RepID=UPI003B9E8873